MKDRIKELRKKLKLTQQEFADSLGMPRSTIAGYEVGKSEPMEGIISFICKQWNVNREWLLNGTGEMFLPKDGYKATKDKFEEMLKDASPNKRAAIGIMVDLAFAVPDDVWDEIIKKIESIVEGSNEEEPHEPTIEERVAEYKMQLEMEEAAKERSGA